jgi:hypothetical protein
MTIRLRGLVPAFALLAPACAVLTMGVAHAQQPYNPNAGQMSYPQSLPSGQVNIPASTARDTGNMAYPASPGGVTESAPRGRDTGNMAYPSGGGAVPRTTAAAAPMAPMGKAPPMRPDVAPTPAQTAAARSLDMAPSSAPVPYTDFLPPAKPMAGKPMIHKRMPMHKAAMKTAPKAAATPAATPAAAPAK